MNDNYNRIAATAQGTANNLGTAFSNQANRTAIDEILEGASQSGNEEDVDMAIGHILRRVSPEHQGKALAILEEKKGKIQQQKAISRKREGLKAAGLSEDLAHLDSSTLNSILNNATKENVANANATSRQNAAETAANSRKEAAETTAKGRVEAAKINKESKAAENAAKPPKLSEFEKKLQGKFADEYSKNEQDIAKATSQLKTVKRLEELGPQLSGTTGYLKGLAGTAEAAEYDALGLTLAEAPIKIFNPVGAIPESKIKRVVEKFSPKATDRVETQKAKIKAAKLIIENAKERAQGRNKLIREYDGNPPTETMAAYDAESESLVDAWDAYADTELKTKGEESNLPDPIVNKGRKIRNEETGETLISNGTEWVKV